MNKEKNGVVNRNKYSPQFKLIIWIVSIKISMQKYFSVNRLTYSGGLLYSWTPGEGQEQKCPHVTIGPNKADAEQFIGSVITFDQIDYKPLGPHDPMVTQRLLSKARPAIISSEAQKAVEAKEAEGTADNVLRPALEKLSCSFKDF